MRAGRQPLAVRGCRPELGGGGPVRLPAHRTALPHPGGADRGRGLLCQSTSQQQRTEGQHGADPRAPIPTGTLHMRGLAGGDTGLAAAETKAAVPPGGQHRVRSQGCSPGAQVTAGQAFAFSAAAGRSENCAAVSPDKGPLRMLRGPASNLRGQGGSTGARQWLSPTQIPQWLPEAPVSSSESRLTLGPR